MKTVLLSILTLENLGDLILLIMLQAVLGFDNLLYISLESQKAPADKQSFVRKMGIGLAIVFRNRATIHTVTSDYLGSRTSLQHKLKRHVCWDV